MTETDPRELLREYAELLEEREQRLSRRERLARKGRIRNKYRLLANWQAALAEYDGPGRATLIDDYRPDGLAAPVDVLEIAGLIIWDSTGQAHQFRLRRDETISFIRCPDDPDAPIVIDPVSAPHYTTVYSSEGLPVAVIERVDALDVTPAWADACDDGAHAFTLVDKETRFERWQCRRCGHSRHTLSWLGHAVPGGTGGE